MMNKVPSLLNHCLNKSVRQNSSQSHARDKNSKKIVKTLRQIDQTDSSLCTK